MNAKTSQSCSECRTKCLSFNSKGAVVLGKRTFFSCIYPSIAQNYSAEEISAVTDELVDFCSRCSQGLLGSVPTTGSLNNSKGDWFELLILEQGLIELGNPRFNDYDLFKIPSATGNHKYWDLFPKVVSERIERIGLHLSNPDFILTRLPDELKSKKYAASSDRMKSLLDRYEDTSFFGKLDPSLIVCNFSVKTHTRPDRRYQHLHEGNVLKAISLRIGTPLQYVVVTTETKEKDDIIFKSASIASVILDEQPRKPAIDRIVRVEKFADIRSAIQRIIHEQPSRS